MEIKVPELGENIKEGDIVKLLVKAGDTLAKDQPLAEIETGKATIEIPSPAAGRVATVVARVGDKVKVGQLLLTLESVDAASAAAPAAPRAEPPAAPSSGAPTPMPAVAPAPPVNEILASVAPPPAPDRVPVAAAPSVRRFAREIGIQIEQVPGTGPRGRVSIEDVKQYAKQLNQARAAAPAGAGPAFQLPDFARWGAVRRETLSTIRRRTAEHMAMAWATIPHVTQHDRADITELEALRKKYAPRAEAAGGKLTMTAILLKIVAAALKNFPKFNASLDLAQGELILKQYYHIGVAVDTDRGLLVPVIRDADRKNIIQLAVELGQIAAKARSGKIAPDDISGGTFTITNLGGIGGSFFTPIINLPEVAILGVGRAVQEPAFGCRDGVCHPRLMLPLSLSYDHRLIDGADGARFLRWVVEAIEEPLVISLEG